MENKMLLKVDNLDNLNSIEMLASIAKMMSRVRGGDYVREDLENMLERRGYTLEADRKKFFEVYYSY